MLNVDLTSFDSSLSGVIIIQPTGILWHNQTSGTMCNHPSVEGFFIPLPMDLSDGIGDHMYDAWGAAAVDVAIYLEERKLDFLFEPSPVEDMYNDAGEAWVPVRVKESIDFTALGLDLWAHAFKDLSGRLGYITYVNSD